MNVILKDKGIIMIFEKMILNGYKKMMCTRCDDKETVFYFGLKDFPGLKKTSHQFKSSMGHILQGYIYSYDNPISNKVVVFDHGFGGGHEAYMKEIEKLCQSGFCVFAYDHTGCMESGGDTLNGMAQSLCDLNDCINNIKNTIFKDYDIYVMGHSWGGFSTLNISAIHTEIKKVVVLSGFVSVELLVNSFFNGILKNYRKVILKYESTLNPEFIRYNAIDSLKNSEADVLLIYSTNDLLCQKETHYDLLFENLKDLPNINFVLEENKGHNPNYTKDAVVYLSEFQKARNKFLKSKKRLLVEEQLKFIKAFDWHKMTEQDEDVWQKIINHLK